MRLKNSLSEYYVHIYWINNLLINRLYSISVYWMRACENKLKTVYGLIIIYKLFSYSHRYSHKYICRELFLSPISLDCDLGLIKTLIWDSCVIRDISRHLTKFFWDLVWLWGFLYKLVFTSPFSVEKGCVQWEWGIFFVVADPLVINASL